MAINKCAAQRREHRGRGSVAKALVAYADTVQPGSGADGREVPCFTESVTPPAAHFHVGRQYTEHRCRGYMEVPDHADRNS